MDPSQQPTAPFEGQQTTGEAFMPGGPCGWAGGMPPQPFQSGPPPAGWAPLGMPPPQARDRPAPAPASRDLLPQAPQGPQNPMPASSFFGPVHIALSWPASSVDGVDLDIAACAYTADGQQLDVCYFKNPSACGGAIGAMGDNQSGYGYQADKEGVFVQPEQLPPECVYVFVVVSARAGVPHLAASGAAVKIVDGEVPGGRLIATAPLNMPTESCVVGVLIRGPPHLYPPTWMLHITSGLPQASGEGKDFTEAVPLIEEYLKASVPPELLANRPPNNPMESFDLNKGGSYFLDPSCRRVELGLGWSSSCDLDVHAQLLDEWYQDEGHVTKGGKCAGVRHSGNAKDGGGGGGGGWFGRSNPNQPDEIVYINLDELDKDVKHIAFCLNIAQGEVYYETNDQGEKIERRRPPPNDFAQVRECFARVLDSDRKFTLANFDLAHDGLPGRSRLMCVLSRFNAGAAAGRWQLIVLGDPMEHQPLHAKAVRTDLIKRTRPDLLRPVHIDFGVISARGLKAADRGGTSDPYVRVKFFDHSHHRTKTIKKTLDPEWNEPKVYSWTGPMANLLERIYCKVDVYDGDMVRDDFLGRAYIHAREVIGTRGRGVIQRRFPLGEKHSEEGEQSKGFFDSVLGYSGKFPGELLLQWEVRGARPGEH